MQNVAEYNDFGYGFISYLSLAQNNSKSKINWVSRISCILRVDKYLNDSG